MSSRRPSSRQLPVVGAPRFRAARPQSFRRPSSTDQSVVTVARSARSTASSLLTSHVDYENLVRLPLTLYEYGFPVPKSRVLQPTTRFPAGPATDYLNSPIGNKLRLMEREYSQTFTQFVIRSVRLAGVSLLVLGSGASKVVTKYLSRGVANVTFVDTDKTALDSLREHVLTTGLEARVAVEYVCQDAWDFLVESDEASYDVVIATKCVGLILAHAPGRTEEKFLDHVVDVLDSDGSFFTDHHVAYSNPSLSGHRVADVAGENYDLATICGRYADDVCYSWTGVSSQITRQVASYTIHASVSMVQSWETFHFRVDPDRPVDSPVVLVPPKVLAPALLPQVKHSPFDSVADAMVPINNKGVKRVPTAADLRGHSLATMRLKFDGTPGVVQLMGAVGVFVSSTRTFAVQLNKTVSPGLTLAAELVQTDTGSLVVVVTGAIAIGGAPADPLDFGALVDIIPLLESLAPSGFAVSTPSMVRLVRGDALQLRDIAGRTVQLPVDGVQITTMGRAGVFIKPSRLITVDAVLGELPGILTAALSAIGNTRGFHVTSSSSGGVLECAYDPTTSTWFSVRERPDKKRSDNLGSVIHTLLSHDATVANNIGTTTEEVIKNIGC